MSNSNPSPLKISPADALALIELAKSGSILTGFVSASDTAKLLSNVTSSKP